MSVQSEITRINGNIASAYTAVSGKGGTLPSSRNSANLPAAIESIPSSGGTLITKTITQNGTYNASDDNADGYSQVTVDVSGGGISSFTLEPNLYRDVLEGADIILVDGSHSTYSDYGGQYYGILVPNITPTILRQIYNKQKDVFISVYFSALPTHFEFFTNAGNEDRNFNRYLLSDLNGGLQYGDSFYLDIAISEVEGQLFVTANNEWFLKTFFDGDYIGVKFSVSIIDRASE